MTDKELQEYIVYKIGFVFFNSSTKEKQQELLNKYGSMLTPEHLQELKQNMKQ
jgi:hypothetical protein